MERLPLAWSLVVALIAVQNLPGCAHLGPRGILLLMEQHRKSTFVRGHTGDVPYQQAVGKAFSGPGHLALTLAWTPGWTLALTPTWTLAWTPGLDP